MAEAAILISQRRLEEASATLVAVLRSLQDTEAESNGCASTANHGNRLVGIQLGELSFRPISRECKIACPDWDADFFCLPFALFAPSERATAKVTQHIALACASASLFMIGLCYHLSAQENEKRCPEAALQASCTFYGRAWATMKQLSRSSNGSSLNEQASTETLVAILRMAVSTNLANVCYKLGELEAANAWLSVLQDLVLVGNSIEDSPVEGEMHDFFLLTSTVNTGFAAAGAA